jgi:hypothetical protein
MATKTKILALPSFECWQSSPQSATVVLQVSSVYLTSALHCTHSGSALYDFLYARFWQSTYSANQTLLFVAVCTPHTHKHESTCTHTHTHTTYTVHAMETCYCRWQCWAQPIVLTSLPPSVTCQDKNKSKAKPSRYCQVDVKGEKSYSSYSFLTSALDGGEGSVSHPGCALPSRKDTRYPLDRRLGGPQSWSGYRG